MYDGGRQDSHQNKAARPPCGQTTSAAKLGVKLAGLLGNGADAVALYTGVTGQEEIAAPAEAVALLASGLKAGIQFANGDNRGAAITLGSTIVGGFVTRSLPGTVTPLNEASQKTNEVIASAFETAADNATEKAAVCGPE